jgi:monoterpene epsilon-lactone hydrolase
MTPRADDSSNNIAAAAADDDTTTVVHKPTNGGPLYTICRSSNPYPARQQTAAQVNATLNLNLGLPICPEHTTLRTIIKLINAVGVSWWEDWVFVAINKLPIPFRRHICLTMWHFYFHIHKRLLGRRTGIHRDASLEYHALTTVMYWGRLFPVSIPRMRFALSQLSVWTNSTVTSTYDRINVDMMKIEESGTNITNNNTPHGYSTQVTGIYVHSGRKTNNVEMNQQNSNKVLFWLYGGAYLSGDVEGNLTPAEMVGKACCMDVFIASYSLIPEAKFDEIVWDVCLAYHWLVVTRKVDPSDIILYGISSGSGLAARMMQMIAKWERKEEAVQFSEILSPMPSAAVLLCPFVDYTEALPESSFVQYSQHDLIVNQSVLECGVPYFDIALGNRRKECSPCYGNCQGLPPLCVVVSEHETVYDETMVLVNKARSQGVDVTLGLWKYQCHVFLFLAAFCPEGKQAMDFANDWIVQEISKNSRAKKKTN